MSNRELIGNALKRVNALAGTESKLYHDSTGWFVRNLPYREENKRLFDESYMTACEMIAYLSRIGGCAKV